MKFDNGDFMKIYQETSNLVETTQNCWTLYM